MTSLRAVSFSDASHGYIAGGFNNDGVVSWTNNGGVTWHAKKLANQFMGGVAASSAGGTAVPQQPSNILYGSTDFGANWTLETPIHALNIRPFDMAYLSGGRRVVVGRLANGDAVAASSVNGGAWKPDWRGPVHVNADGDPIPTYAELQAIDAVSSGSVAWTVGQDRTSRQYPPWAALIFKTTDGSTWTTQTAPAAASAGLNCVAAVDAQTAFIGENAKAVLRTTNGGTTWTRLAYTSVTMPAKVRAIDAWDANKVLIVGDGGKIAWTTNALAATPAWNVNATATSNSLFGAQMIDEKHWIVVGDNETIMRTSDAGAHWTGSTSVVAPSIAITPMPSRASLLSSSTISLGGTSSDGKGIGVAEVALRFQNRYGRYWNGSSWGTGDSWVVADKKTQSLGWDQWKDAVTFPSTSSFGGALTITARATDGTGQRSYVSVGKAALGAPKLSTSYVRRSRSFTTSGDLFPRHTAGSTALEFVFQRWEKKSGKYQYVTKTHPSAKAVTKSTSTSTWSYFKVSKSLTSGKWRVRTKHSDATHGTVYSSYKYFTVH